MIKCRTNAESASSLPLWGQQSTSCSERCLHRYHTADDAGQPRQYHSEIYLRVLASSSWSFGPNEGVAASPLPAARATLALMSCSLVLPTACGDCGAASCKFIYTSCVLPVCCCQPLSQQERTSLKVVYRVRHLRQWPRLEEAVRPSVSGIWSASPGLVVLYPWDPLHSPCEVRAKGQALTWTVCVCVLRVVRHT